MQIHLPFNKVIEERKFSLVQGLIAGFAGAINRLGQEELQTFEISLTTTIAERRKDKNYLIVYVTVRFRLINQDINLKIEYYNKGIYLLTAGIKLQDCSICEIYPELHTVTAVFENTYIEFVNLDEYFN